MKRAATASLVLALLWPCVVVAQQGTIEDIKVLGLFRMSEEAFLHALRVQKGDAYDETVLRGRFKSLWGLGLFDDIVLESENAPGGGKALVIKVKERPVLTSVTYEDNSVATRTSIEDRLAERGIALKLGKPIDMGTIFYAETIIRDLLAEKGHLNSEVDSEVRKITETSRAVHFFITGGGKTRIRKIEFTGNEVLSNRKLKGFLQLTQERKWYWPWSAKNLYHPVKWDQDASGIGDAYQNRGYLDVQVRTPIVEVTESKKGSKSEPEQPGPDAPPTETPPDRAALDELTPKQQERLAKKERKEAEQARKKEKKAKKVKRWVRLTVPIVEGPQYTLGEITITGNEVFPSNVLRAGIPLKAGATLFNDGLEYGVDRIRRLYEDRGHLYANVVRRIQRHEDEYVADVEVSIDEDRPYVVGRIDFAGNSSTRDNVLRREVLLAEGDLFSRSALDVSKAKINQLGYFQVPEDPAIQPEEDEGRVKVTFAGEEQGRNEIQVGGGYSGIDGAFFNGVYSTRNFLGRGQVVSVALQLGGRSNRYQVSFQEPWFLNRPYRLGFSLFRTDVDFGSSLRSTSTGAGVLLGKRLGRFANIDVGYNWRSVDSRTVLTATGAVDQLTSITTQTEVSSLTPVYNSSTINNPYRPTAGRQFTVSFQIAGGPFGGDTSFLKPIITFTKYRRAFGRSFIALHLQGGMVREWQGGSIVTGSNIQGIPRFERFWLGGDTLGPRIFETRSITPLRYVILREGQIFDVIKDPRFLPIGDDPNNGLVDSGGLPVLIEAGGDRFFLFQTEYVIPLNEQVEVAAFLDVGDALFEDQSFNFETTRVSAGLEVRFHLPIFPVPLRLIYGVPVREITGDRTSNFTFSIGRSF